MKPSPLIAFEEGLCTPDNAAWFFVDEIKHATVNNVRAVALCARCPMFQECGDAHMKPETQLPLSGYVIAAGQLWSDSLPRRRRKISDAMAEALRLMQRTETKVAA